MSLKKLCRSLIVCVVVIACLGLTTAASVRHDETVSQDELECSVVNVSIVEYSVSRASGNINADIPANTIVAVNDPFTMSANELVTFDCSYTPRSASVDFGVIGPDGLFYSINVTNGSINKSICADQRGTYRIAIMNNSSETIHVVGDISY